MKDAGPNRMDDDDRCYGSVAKGKMNFSCGHAYTSTYTHIHISVRHTQNKTYTFIANLLAYSAHTRCVFILYPSSSNSK